ncbi:MAG: sigma-70 family RNA polymerase sigma factor [bacterium]
MDKEIVNSVLKGNTEDFSLIIDKYQKMVYNLCYKVFNNSSDAEDFTQETFIKVYRNLHKCQEKSSMKNWIYTICYNTCIDEVRKRKGKNNLSLDLDLELDDDSIKIEVPSNEKTPENIMIEKESLLEVEQAVNSLSQTSRTLIYLRDIKGLSYSEISEIMNINLGTVKSSLNRTRKNLQKILRGKK